MNGWQFLLENEEKLSEINIEQLYRQIAINWCEKNGYTDPFQVEQDWWGFPPGAVIPVLLSSYIEDDLYNALVHLYSNNKT